MWYFKYRNSNCTIIRNLRKGKKIMKRVLKVLNVFLILLLVVGCTTSQSVTQKLAGVYRLWWRWGCK